MKFAFKHFAGLFAIVALILMAGPAPRAQALTLATPGIASSNGASALDAATEVHWRGYPHAHRHYYGRYYHPYRHHYYHPYRYGYRHHYYHHRRYY